MQDSGVFRRENAGLWLLLASSPAPKTLSRQAMTDD
jgi:hypothetical protein